jgi:pilus assembly protein Flp/PilA
MMSFVKRLWTEEEGADATEYALLAALIAVAIIGTATTLGTSISGVFSTITAALP